jgi:hypothetical protein
MRYDSYLYSIVKPVKIKVMEKIKEVREHFENEYPYVDLGMLSDDTINAFLNQSYIASLWFEKQMDCLYDYILSQDLCGVEE